MALCPAKVAIIGHSFVRRLQSYVNQDDSKRNLGLTYTSHQVAMRGGGGRRISHLQQEFAFIGHMQPEVVLIDIGTNDLDSLRKPVQVLARELFQVAATLRDRYNVKLVVICEVFYRTPVGRYASSNPNFNELVHEFNQTCKTYAASASHVFRNIHFWHHSGLVHNWQQYIVDGVHFNELGLFKYFRSLRSAVIRFSSMARHQ